MSVIERAPTRIPLTPAQRLVCILLGLGMNYPQIAAELGIACATVERHTYDAAAKIPGDLPMQTKCAIWARGAAVDVLEGARLRYETAPRRKPPGGRGARPG